MLLRTECGTLDFEVGLSHLARAAGGLQLTSRPLGLARMLATAAPPQYPLKPQ